MNNILIVLLPRTECYLAQKEKLQDEGEVTHSQLSLVFVAFYSSVFSSNGSYRLQTLEGLQLDGERRYWI